MIAEINALKVYIVLLGHRYCWDIDALADRKCWTYKTHLYKILMEVGLSHLYYKKPKELSRVLSPVNAGLN